MKNEYLLETLNEERLSLLQRFSCGNGHIDNYFHHKIKYDDDSVCYVYWDEKAGEIIGVASVCCSGIGKNLQLLFRFFTICFVKAPVPAPSSQMLDVLSQAILFSILWARKCELGKMLPIFFGSDKKRRKNITFSE
ncbi:MAG: hypothetical protein IJ849_10650 [Selenomonadaceae bacterium]|nr:hypothetical protein [Selenomonadaceae bacterium]